MELWNALKTGAQVRVFFPSVDVSSPVRGEYLALRVVSLETPISEHGTFIADVLDEPESKVGVVKGERIRVQMNRVEEIQG